MRRILVVDDEPGICQMLEWNLKAHDVHVDTAGDGVEAESKVLAGDYALVLSDISMPRMDGLRLLRLVKRRRPSTAVLLMTGFGTVETAVQAMKEGAADFILKPFPMGTMLSRVRELLGLPAVAEGDTQEV